MEEVQWYFQSTRQMPLHSMNFVNFGVGADSSLVKVGIMVGDSSGGVHLRMYMEIQMPQQQHHQQNQYKKQNLDMENFLRQNRQLQMSFYDVVEANSNANDNVNVK